MINMESRVRVVSGRQRGEVGLVVAVGAQNDRPGVHRKFKVLLNVGAPRWYYEEQLEEAEGSPGGEGRSRGARE